MNIKDYLKGLMPRLQRSDLDEAIAKLNGEMNETVLPIYESAVELFGERKFKVALACHSIRELGTSSSANDQRRVGCADSRSQRAFCVVCSQKG